MAYGMPIDMDREAWEDLGRAIARFDAGDAEARARPGTAAADAFNRIAARAAEAGAETERVRAVLAGRQNDLLALQRRLARAERFAALGALAARLAHELGTPLHSVAGHLDLLLADKRLPPELRERAEIVAGEVDRLSTLIRSHLRRLRAPQPKPRRTDLNALIVRIVEVMRPLLGARGIEPVLDLQEAAGEPFPCDPARVEQVVVNLVQNAIDAMPDGGRLGIATTVTESGRAVSVADDGLGIDPDHLDRVFEPFFTTKRPGRGTGLGLSLCREIARAHGGDVAIDSKPDLGTVVTLSLGKVRRS